VVVTIDRACESAARVGDFVPPEPLIGQSARSPGCGLLFAGAVESYPSRRVLSIAESQTDTCTHSSKVKVTSNDGDQAASQKLVRDRRGNGPVRSADRDLVVSIDRARQVAAVGCGNRSTSHARYWSTSMDSRRVLDVLEASGHPMLQFHKGL
jgi:hypothetical protein